MKRIISLILAIAIVLSCWSMFIFNASAASSVMNVSKSSLKVGDQLTVKVTVNGDAAMYAVQFALSYDPAVLEFVSGDSSSGGAGVVLVAAPLTGSTSGTFSYVFKAVKAGTSNIATADLQYSDGESIIPVANQGASVTVKDETLSDNANITALTVGGKKVTVSASKTSYSVTVGREVTDCAVYVTTADKSAKVAVTGNKNLQIGDNTCKITVTAPSGAQKIYTLTITRSETGSSETEEPTEGIAPLDTEIDGALYTVAASLEGVVIPQGFTVKTVMYNDTEVQVIADENNEYEIYYLTSSENAEFIPYTLNPETKTFEKLKYIKQLENFYIFAEIPEDKVIPAGYYDTHTRISDFDVACYFTNDEKMSDFYYVYCYNGKKYEFYRFDSKEGTLQRYPEMHLSNKATVAVDEEEEKDLISKFKMLTSNAKIVVIGIAFLVLLTLALVILLVLKVIASRRNAELASTMGFDEFDSINFDTAFTLEDDDYSLEDAEEENIDFEDGEAPDYLVDEESQDKPF